MIQQSRIPIYFKQGGEKGVYVLMTEYLKIKSRTKNGNLNRNNFTKRSIILQKHGIEYIRIPEIHKSCDAL